MKKILLQEALLLSAMMVSLSATSITSVVPVRGHDENIKTDVVVQNSTEETHLRSGISDSLCEFITKDESATVEEKEKIIKWSSAWTTSNVNVRATPSTKANIYDTYQFNKKISFVEHNKDWVKIKYKNQTAYMAKKYISTTENISETYSVPSNDGFKSYLPYDIFSKSSKQYKLQQQAYTGNYGIRMVDGRYCVAIGTYFLEDKTNDCIGTYFDIVLENGEIIPCVLGDVKADQHTDNKNMYTLHNGCYTEFIVDLSTLNSDAKRDGDISSVKEEWDSPVEKIIVYEKKIE